MTDRHLAMLVDQQGRTVDIATGDLTKPDDWCSRYKFEALVKKARPGDSIQFTTRRLSADELADIRKADEEAKAKAEEADRANLAAAYRKALDDLDAGVPTKDVERQLETDLPF